MQKPPAPPLSFFLVIPEYSSLLCVRMFFRVLHSQYHRFLNWFAKYRGQMHQMYKRPCLLHHRLRHWNWDEEPHEVLSGASAGVVWASTQRKMRERTPDPYLIWEAVIWRYLFECHRKNYFNLTKVLSLTQICIHRKTHCLSVLLMFYWATWPHLLTY